MGEKLRYGGTHALLNAFVISFVCHAGGSKVLDFIDNGSKVCPFWLSTLSHTRAHTLYGEMKRFSRVQPFLWSCRDPSKQTDLSISVMYISRQHCSWMKSLQISGWISPSSGLKCHTAGSSSAGGTFTPIYKMFVYAPALKVLEIYLKMMLSL